MNLHLQIDHLVLDGLGLDPGDGDLVRASVEAELSRLLVTTGLPGLRTGGARASAPGGAVHLAGGDTPATVGSRIAHAVYEGIVR